MERITIVLSNIHVTLSFLIQSKYSEESILHEDSLYYEELQEFLSDDLYSFYSIRSLFLSSYLR